MHFTWGPRCHVYWIEALLRIWTCPVQISLGIIVVWLLILVFSAPTVMLLSCMMTQDSCYNSWRHSLLHYVITNIITQGARLPSPDWSSSVGSELQDIVFKQTTTGPPVRIIRWCREGSGTKCDGAVGACCMYSLCKHGSGTVCFEIWCSLQERLSISIRQWSVPSWVRTAQHHMPQLCTVELVGSLCTHARMHAHKTTVTHSLLSFLLCHVLGPQTVMFLAFMFVVLCHVLGPHTVMFLAFMFVVLCHVLGPQTVSCS
jgi:hypothetical protein